MKQQTHYQGILVKILLTWVALCLSVTHVFADNTVTLSTRQISPLNAITKPIVKEAYRRIGLDVQFVHFRGNRSIIEANKGTTDGEVNRLKFVINKFKNLHVVPVPLYYSEIVAITVNPEIKISGWESLSQFKTVAPGSFRLIWARLKDHNNTQKVSNSLEALTMLSDETTEVAILNRYEAERLMRIYKSEKFIINTPPLEVHEIFHLVHIKNQHLIPALTTALQEMTREGFLKRIWKEHDGYFD